MEKKNVTLVVICILHISLGMNDVIITSQGKHWPWSISETLSIIGRKQCTEECQARGSACLAVNYLRTHLQCQILKKTPNNLSELVDDINYEYIEMESQTSVFTSAVCSSSCKTTGGNCIGLSSGTSYCRSPKPKCPTNYRYSLALDFCYIAITVEADYQGAKTYCEGLGARLAVLPTRAHIDFLKSERTNGFLSSLRYLVGGQWDPVSGSWRWIDGSLIFEAIDITPCRILANSGVIAWENKYLLMDRDPTLLDKFICEKVLV
ncbi:uncharacterized protein LOC111119257 [Crassostrea virginica]